MTGKQSEDIKILPEGDSAILIEFPKTISPEINGKITSLAHLIKEQHIEGVMDMIPAFCSLLIHYDPRVISYGKLLNRVNKIMKLNLDMKSKTKKVYEEVIKIHSSKDYLIYMIGFLPGFSYLGGLDERIHTPRLANPRIKIPAGSVGIGGAQTGIYPLESPGGWQLIGKTPVKTYDSDRKDPILFEAGDYIRFVPISEAEFEKIEKEVEENKYECIVHKEEVE